MQQAIDRGTRTSVPANGGINKWLHKYMLVVPGVGGLHVVTEPWTEPPAILSAHWAVLLQQRAQT